MKRYSLFIAALAVITTFAVKLSTAQQPGGLPAKFSAEIKRDVAEFVQGQADANSIANLQNNIVGIIQRTGTDSRILSQIVSDAVNQAAQVHGSTIKKISKCDSSIHSKRCKRSAQL